MSKTRPHRDVDAIPDLPVAAPAAEVVSRVRDPLLGNSCLPRSLRTHRRKRVSNGSGHRFQIRWIWPDQDASGTELDRRERARPAPCGTIPDATLGEGPHRPLLTPADDQWRDVVLRATRVEDIEDKAYRQSLFIEPRLSAKAALVIRAPDHALYVNFYRGVDRPPFTPEELDAIRRSGDVLVAMIERHFALTNDEAAGDLNAVQRLIAEAAQERGATLSTREASACAHIVLGYSIKGIGLILGVSSHSVVSYRRRAFAKLGIGTQKELFSLVLRKRWLLGL